MGDATQPRPILGRGLDVVCVSSDEYGDEVEQLAATEFVVYISMSEISEALQTRAENMMESLEKSMSEAQGIGDDVVGAEHSEQCVMKLVVLCNGKEIVDNLTGRADGVAVVEPSGRVAFVDPDGSHSYFASDGILTEMKLKRDSPNLIEFRCPEMKFSSTCLLWLWSIHDHICVVDIDGTVTVEDVRGYVETVYMGVYTYIHEGIVTLLHKLNAMKLRLMFLTSRPVDHITETREFLGNIMEEDVTVPESPLFMSQDFVLEALYREVIYVSS